VRPVFDQRKTVNTVLGLETEGSHNAMSYQISPEIPQTPGKWAAPTGATIDRTYRNAGGVAYFIPTENEWYKAAYDDPNKGGTGIAGYWDYPTKHDLPDEPDGIDFNGDTVFDAVFIQGYDLGQPNSVDNAGVLSAYGTMGQGGNVLEWNETAIDSGRGLRGGFWAAHSFVFQADYTNWGGPSAEIGYIGFRVASVPEPGSLTLMLCGGLAGLYWWKRRKWHPFSFLPFALYLSRRRLCRRRVS
jgi:hypothetical protein